MKKEAVRYAILILLVCILAFAIPACIAMRNWYSDEKPWDYKSSVWISEDPYFLLTVDEQGQAACTAGKGNSAVSFRVDYRGNNVYFLTTDEEGHTIELAHGSGNYSSEKFTVTLNKGFTIPGLYDDPIFKIVFIRQK